MKKLFFLAVLALSAASAWAGEPLKWSKPIIDGATYAIVNVQPNVAAATSNYYLNNSEGTLTPETIAKDATTDFVWPATAKFVAEKQADGKFAFKNVSNDMYLAYKSHNTGENDRSGFYATVTDWSSWTMNASTSSGFEGTYWPTCAKRNSGYNGVASTLLLTNAGEWNAWGNSECTNTAYSNTYGFVLLNKTYTVHYNYKVDGVKVAEEDLEGLEGLAYPNPTIPYGVSTTTTISGTVSGDASFDVDCTIDSNYPFKYSTDFATATWYQLTIRGVYHVYYDEANDKFVNTGANGAKVTQDKGYFAFVGSPWGTKIINRAKGEGFAITGTPTVNNSALTTTTFADAIEFVFENNDSHYVFAAKDNPIAHLNNVADNANLGFWVNTNSAKDAGSTLIFEQEVIGINWEAFEERLTQLQKYTFGEGLGKYAEIDLSEYWFTTVSEALDTFATDLEDREESYYEVDVEIMDLLLENLSINLPEKGTFLRIKGGESGNYVAFTGADGARVPQQADGTDAKTIIYYAEDGTIISYYNGKGMTGTHSQATVGGTMDKATFTASKYGIGKYCIKSNSTSSQVWYDHSSAVNRNSSENSANCAWVLEEVTALPVSVSAAGYATLYAPVALSIPTGVEAYTLTLNGDYLQAAALTGKIPANTAVVLKANEGNYNFDITTADAFTGSNVLEGTITTIANEGALVLNVEEGVAGFYGYGGNLAGFKAYYVAEGGENSNLRIVLDNNTLTSIISAAQQNGGQAIYDLQGRRVVNAQNGLYIINGKKVIK